MSQNVLFLLMAVGLAASDNNAESKLKQGRSIFYRELGCKPMNEAQTRFECPDIASNIPKDKCYFDGQEYDIGHRIEDSAVTSKFCTASCICQKPYSGEIPKFNCAHIDCPEFFGHHLQFPPDKKCIRSYEEGKCCATGLVCDEELEALAKCEFEGKTFYEGQKIYPEGDCATCRCTKGFDNSTIAGNPNCETSSCDVRQFHSEEVYKGCAPIYYKTVCCPIEYRCPAETDTVISEGRSSEGSCKFGKLEVGVGGEINSVKEDTICRCVAPPFIECLQTPPHLA